jgi:hypothetical protein
MGEWTRVALERAAFWCLLEEEMGSAEEVAGVARELHARRRYKPRPQKRDDDEADRVWPVSAILPRMGQMHAKIEIPRAGERASGTFLRMGWKIKFDWTGDARNELSVLVGTTGKCKSTRFC